MMNILLDLFLTFAKIGLFTFGGGYAMIGIFENVCVETKKWISHDDMMNITVIAESTPGPIAINCATFIGYKQAKVIGSVIATLGVVLPSFAVIFLISMCLDNFMELTLVANAFKGIKVGVGVVIVNAAVNMIKKMSSKKKKFITDYNYCDISIIWNIVVLRRKISEYLIWRYDIVLRRGSI